MFSYFHKVWSLQSPRDSSKQSDFPAISIKPITDSAYPFPIPCSWILLLTTSLTWIKRESPMLFLLGVCFILLDFLFISLLCSYPVCMVPGKRYRQIAYWSFWMLSENPKISCSPFTLLAVFLHHYGFYTDNYYLQTEVNYLLSLTEKIRTFNNVF